MIEIPVVDGWKVMMYERHEVAMFPPYAENAKGTLTIECDGKGEVELWAEEEWRCHFVPRAVFAALFAAVDDWKQAQQDEPSTPPPIDTEAGAATPTAPHPPGGAHDFDACPLPPDRCEPCRAEFRRRRAHPPGEKR